eukprot:gene4225-4786_t
MADDESKWLEVNVQGKQSRCTVSGQKITIDNVDYWQEVHHMTQDHQTVDNHYLFVPLKSGFRKSSDSSGKGRCIEKTLNLVNAFQTAWTKQISI